MEKYLVYGLGISGISSIKTLSALGKEVLVYDNKNKEELVEVFKELENCKYTWIDNIEKELNKDTILLKSPGIPEHNPIILKAIEKGMDVISDLELVTRLFPERKVIAITGTNGKTTTSTLMKEILLGCGLKGKAIGNIGLGMLWEIYCGNKDDIYVIECSSFQLAHTKYFHPDYSAIINISPDHIDWHGSYDRYKDAKKNIFRNQTAKDYTILNADNNEVRILETEVPSQKIFVSTVGEKNSAIFVEKTNIYLKDTKEPLLNSNDIPIKGSHNLENVLIALGISYAMQLDMEKVAESIRSFRAVEHRLEYVKEIDGVKYYNDSKGTNVDASIKAIEAFEEPIILLAGGYDKKADLTPLFDAMKGRVKYLILFGDTKEQFFKIAASYDIEAEIVDGMEMAVKIADEKSVKGDIVLLSPASAAWGMYDNFEIRGRDFKEKVEKL